MPVKRSDIPFYVGLAGGLIAGLAIASLEQLEGIFRILAIAGGACIGGLLVDFVVKRDS